MQVHGSELLGRPVVAWPGGQRIGEVADLLLDQTGRYVVALVVRTGLWGSGQRIVPLNQVRTTDWQGIAVEALAEALSTLATERTWGQRRDLAGKRLLTESGHELGQFDDIAFDLHTGLIASYRLTTGIVSDWLDGRPRVAGRLGAVTGDHLIVMSEPGGVEGMH